MLTEPAPAPSRTIDAADLLRLAHQVVADEFHDTDPLAQAALHLITCAAGAVSILDSADLDAAREALDHARAAVTAATYAVLRIHDNARIGSS
jgi:hypothetical protein